MMLSSVDITKIEENGIYRHDGKIYKLSPEQIEKVKRLNRNKNKNTNLRFDLKRINSDGMYVDLNNSNIFTLTDNQIVRLREKYPNIEIAPNRIISKKKVKNSYSLKRDRINARAKIDFSKILLEIIKVALAGSIIFVSVNAGYKLLETNILTEIDSKDYTSSNDAITLEMDNNIDLEDNSDLLDASTIIVSKEEETRREIIGRLCQVYQVNYNMIYDKLVSLTDNFTSEDYLVNHHIDGVKCKGEEVYARSEEELLLKTIRCARQMPDKLGFDSSVIINTGYESSTNFDEQVEYICNLLNLDPVFLYSLIQSETSFNSPLFLQNHNAIGMRYNGEWFSFDNFEQGIYDAGLQLEVYESVIDKNKDYVEEIIKRHNGPEVDTHVPMLKEIIEYNKNNSNLCFNNLDDSFRR